MEDSHSRLLFEITGKPTKVWLFKKLRSHVAVYDNKIEIEFDGACTTYARNDIFDAYILEPVSEDIDSRTTLIHFYDKGYTNCYILTNSVFPGFAEQMEIVLRNEWSHLMEKRAYPKTVQWFVACCAVAHIHCRENPYVFGGQYKEPDSIADARQAVYEGWGFNNKQDAFKMLPELLAGRSVKEYRECLEDSEPLNDAQRDFFEYIAACGGERCFWAFDLQRLIILCECAYLSDWLSWEEALQWCLKAGQKLQSVYNSWDEFMDYYLLAYCFWSDEDMEDKDSNTYKFRQIYEYYKKLKTHPWQIAWNHPLMQEW